MNANSNTTATAQAAKTASLNYIGGNRLIVGETITREMRDHFNGLESEHAALIAVAEAAREGATMLFKAGVPSEYRPKNFSTLSKRDLIRVALGTLNTALANLAAVRSQNGGKQ